MKKAPRPANESPAAARRTLDLCIAHPADANALRACLQHLEPRLTEQGLPNLELVVVVDGPADTDTAPVIQEFASRHAMSARVLEQPLPLGRARSLNRALRATAEAGHDLLLLDPATRLGPGSLRELVSVAAGNPRAGFVAPRSTRGLFSALPVMPGAETLHAQVKLGALEVLARSLPRASAQPLLDAQCLHVRHGVLVDAGGLTEAFGVRTHHEWEWILRAGDSGWLAVMANHAVVEVVGVEASEGAPRPHPESVAAMQRLHPGLDDALAWAGAADARAAEGLLAGLLPDEAGRLRLAVDISQAEPSCELDSRRLTDAVAALARRSRERLSITVLCDSSLFRRLGLDRIEGLSRRQLASAGLHAVALEVVGRRRPATPSGLAVVAPVQIPVFVTDEPVDRLLLRGAWGEHQALRRRLRRVNGFVVQGAEDANALRAALELGHEPAIVTHPGSTRLSDHLVALDVGPPSHVLCVDDAVGSGNLPPALAAWAADLKELPVLVAGRGDRRGQSVRVVDWQAAQPAQRRQWLSAAAAVVIVTQRVAPLGWVGLALASGKPLVLRNSLGNRRQLAHWGLEDAAGSGVFWVGDEDDIASTVEEAVLKGAASPVSDTGPDWDSWADTVIRFALEQASSPEVHRRLQRRLDTAPGRRRADADSDDENRKFQVLSPLEQLLTRDDDNFIAGAYQMLLRRDADPAGLEFYRALLGRGIARADVLLSLSMSQEALSNGRRSIELDQHLAGHLGRIMRLEGRRFVDQAFLSLLMRNADDAGLAHFVGQLESGRPKLDILVDIARSPEGRARGARPSVLTSLVTQHEATTRHRVVTAD